MGILKLAFKQVGITALSVVTQKAGLEIGKVVVEKGTEEINKRVLKKPEQPVMQQREPLKTGNDRADIAVNLAMSVFNNMKNKQPEAIIEQPANDTAPEVSITEKAEVIGNTVAKKTEETVSVAKQIGAGFLKGLNKK